MKPGRRGAERWEASTVIGMIDGLVAMMQLPEQIVSSWRKVSALAASYSNTAATNRSRSAMSASWSWRRSARAPGRSAGRCRSRA